MRALRALPALLWAALLLSAALGCVPTPAQASETARLKVAFSPYRLGRSTTLQITLDLGVAGAEEGVPSPLTRFDMSIPPNLELIGSNLGLAICRPAALLASGLQGCSPNARLGLGRAEIEVPVGPEAVPESASIQAVMGPPVGEQIGVLLYTEAYTPVAAQLIFPGVLTSGTGSVGQGLSTFIPLIPALPGAPDISMVSMSLTLGPDHLTYYRRVHGRTVGYRPEGVSLPARCPPKGFRFVSDMAFQDGTTVTAASTVPCPSARHR